MSKKQHRTSGRNTALCYVRQSFTRDDDDTNSPERQRANIQAVVEKHGWKPEWYEDVGGHKSGRYEKNRPQWMALKARISEPNVIALIANDMSRLHRKGWRVGDLIDYLTEHDVNLILAAPGREVDTTTVQGRMFLQFGAIVDEYYAEDISQRAKDNIAFRKKQGKTIGRPPFGTVRNEAGYLTASTEGAWLMPDGTFRTGTKDTKPHEETIWRSYYSCAECILLLYAEGNRGLETIAYQLNTEGWPFRNRKGQPRSVTRDDIRRVIANWPEYGGITSDRKAKDRPAHEGYNVDELPFNHDRAVFPIELLRQVARIRLERTRKRTKFSSNRKAYAYPLTTITFCAHCERLAQAQNKPDLRTTLTGWGAAGGDTLRYKHKTGVKCGSTRRSVPTHKLEADVGRLIGLLEVDPEAIDLLLELARQTDSRRGLFESDEELGLQKKQAIDLCQRRIDAAVHLFGEGRISRAEYLRRVEANEREIAHWQSRTSETEKMALELAMCMDSVTQLKRAWNDANPDNKQRLVRDLFTRIVYDLDSQRIVDFRLKSWADQFIILRAELHKQTYPELAEMENSRLDDESNRVPHRGLEPLF